MRLEKTLPKLAFGQSKEEMLRAARDLGHELPRHRWDVCRKFRSEVAGIKYPNCYNVRLADYQNFREGFIDALLEVTAAYEAATEDLKIPEGYFCFENY